MNPQQFKKILRTFSDPGSDIVIDSHNLWVQINDNIIDCTIEVNDNNVYIKRDGQKIPALKWILSEIARIDILANRILNVLKNDEAYVFPELRCEDLDAKCDLSNFGGFTNFIRSHSVLTTGVVYLTSDAGEGKTSFVNELAIHQARLYADKKVDFIIVPISLGGRTFHRFDDIVMGALANKYRFPFMNYEAFMEMIKLGVLIPALDGFEEMFVETGTGEALSAMGILLNGLDSSGSVIVSARKAYYEFENLKIQPKLFDIIRDLDVNFFKVDIERWDKNRFTSYLKNCKISNPDAVYRRIVEVLSSDHAIITRPVLAKKFVDLIGGNNLESILPKLKDSGNHFFASLVDSIIDREAKEKWLEKNGSDSILSPLISVENHYDLLSLLALEMWTQKKDYLNSEVVSFVVELYAEATKMSAEKVRQVKERLKGHALLIISKNDTRCIEFDHEEFKEFFLARQIAQLIKKAASEKRASLDLISVFRKSLINNNTKNLISSFIDKNDLNDDVFKALESISIIDGVNSYAHQNSADIIASIISKFEHGDDFIELKGYNFGVNALSGENYNYIKFYNCSFSTLKFGIGTTLKHCKFMNCEFEILAIEDYCEFVDSEFVDCNVMSFEYKGKKYFDPNRIRYLMIENGLIKLSSGNTDMSYAGEEIDERLVQLEKILRYFLRSTHISESVVRIKLGNHTSNDFISNVMPDLETVGVIMQVENKGSGSQKRYKLAMDMSVIENAIGKSKGIYEDFIKIVRNR